MAFDMANKVDIPPVIFSAPTLGDPDVRLEVFSIEYHVHSKKIEEYSKFFHTFNNSEDRVGKPPPSSKFKYEWVTKVDASDPNDWSLVHSGPKTEELNVSTFAGDTNFEQSVFEKLLLATYMRRYTITTLAELLKLTKRADYYQMIPVVTYSLVGAIHQCHDPIAFILENPCAALEAAIKLKSPEFYRDSFILSLGPFHAPAYQKYKEQFTDRDVYDTLEDAFIRLQGHSFQVVNWFYNEIHDEEQAWITALQSRWQQRIDESLDEFDILFWPFLYRKIHDVDFDDSQCVHDAMEPILRNDLTLDHCHYTSGARGAFQAYFLSASIDDSVLPWNREA